MPRTAFRLTTCLGLLGAVLATPLPASAGGFEFPAPGTRALGRGGAFYARADDPMALLYNPANLAGLPGTQLSLQAHLAFFDACFQRTNAGGGTYRSVPSSHQAGASGLWTRFDSDISGDPFVDAGNGWGDSRYPEVCNTGHPGVVPELVFTHRLNAQMGFGAGLVAPAGIGHTVWGEEDGTTNGLPSPSRYLLVSQDNLIAYPAVGFAYSPHRRIRIGATFLWGIGAFDFTTYSRPVVGEDPAEDARTVLTAQDFFIPGGVVSAHFIPHDNLDITLSFRISDDVSTDSGETEATWGDFGIGTEAGDIVSTVPTTSTAGNISLQAPQPWQLALGVRYADRISPRPEDPAAVERLSGRVEDPMSNERWDVEVDAVWEINSRVDEFVVTTQAPQLSRRESTGAGTVVETMLPLPRNIRLPHNWQHQLSLRVGGDYNVIPGMVALRAGASFETNGIDEAFTALDFLPAMRFGVHAGLTVRIGRFDISLAYAHIFQETIEVSTDQARVPAIDATNPDPGVNARGCTDDPDDRVNCVNAGTYEANFDVLSLGVTWHI